LSELRTQNFGPRLSRASCATVCGAGGLFQRPANDAGLKCRDVTEVE